MTRDLFSHLSAKRGREGKTKTMKKYIIPTMEIRTVQPTSMLAESLNISDTTVDGGDALTKEDAGWDIWNTED